MKFQVEHVISGIGPAAYEKLYFDEPFNIALCEALRMKRTLLTLDVIEAKLRRRVKVSPQRDIPGPLMRLLGGRTIEYTECIDYVMGALKGTWRTELAVMADKVESFGTFSFDKHPQGVLRCVQGEVNVKVFGLGTVAERFIVADVERGYQDAADFTNRWLREKPDAAKV